MKQHFTFSGEWKRQLAGGAVIGGIYAVVAILTGLSGTVSGTGIPALGTVLGVMLGCVYLVVNTLLLDLTNQRILRGISTQRFYKKSYLGRYLLAGVTLFIGFMFLDPFAVFVVLISPKITYFFCGVTGLGIDRPSLFSRQRKKNVQ